jgi:UDP-N-acetylglucosamine 2-epimerase (non-hydrolysing)
MHIVHIVGARPNFMKIAPVYRALENDPRVRQTIVHTGQHYDFNMSDVFFQQLGLPQPHVLLGVGSGTHARQTAEVMTRLEPFLEEQRPDWVLVYGDVNSTMAAALVCAKLLIRTAHVEAGLRSFDRTMPEEVNRLVTDQLADLLFTPSADGDENLAREGIASEKVRLVGNVMIDTLVRLLPEAESRRPALLQRLGLEHESRGYALVTLHRPSNVDQEDSLAALTAALDRIGRDLVVLFAVHPRTRQRMASFGLKPTSAQVRLIDPVGYLDFLALQQHAAVVVTDSGGIQEETTFLQVPCLTVRENTERPITVTQGTNRLVGREPSRLVREVQRVLAGETRRGKVPPLWDGHAGERIAAVLTAESAAAQPAPAICAAGKKFIGETLLSR